METGQGTRDSRTDPGRGPLSRTQKALAGVVSGGAVVIAGLGFAGSYTAVRRLALAKGFGWYAQAFPVGVDAGIVVFLALDLLLTGLRMPYPALRQAAWLLTGATIAFNASVSWGDPLAVGMHAVTPLLFVVVVEAARHAVGRIADVVADRFIESPPLVRWLLSPVPTFLVWRLMRLWQITSYEEVIRLQKEKLALRTRLRCEHGRGWRKQASQAQILALKLSRYGTPVSRTLEAEASRALLAAVPAPQPVPAVSPAVPTVVPVPVPAAVPAVPAPVPVVSLVKAPRVPTVVPSVSPIGTPTKMSELVQQLVRDGRDNEEIRTEVLSHFPGAKPETVRKNIYRARSAA